MVSKLIANPRSTTAYKHEGRADSFFAGCYLPTPPTQSASFGSSSNWQQPAVVKAQFPLKFWCPYHRSVCFFASPCRGKTSCRRSGTCMGGRCPVIAVVAAAAEWKKSSHAALMEIMTPLLGLLRNELEMKVSWKSKLLRPPSVGSDAGDAVSINYLQPACCLVQCSFTDGYVWVRRLCIDKHLCRHFLKFATLLLITSISYESDN